METAFQRVFRNLKRHGVLLQTDARLPNVCALVTGSPVRGSWWAHPGSHEIFRVNCALADHPDVLVVKLISARLTYRDTLEKLVESLNHEFSGNGRLPWQL
jgi:hypothetical protein